MSDTDINPCPLHDTSVTVTNCNVLLDNNTDDLLLRADNHTGIRILRHIINEPGSKRTNIHPLMNDTEDGVDYTCYVYGWLHGSNDNTGGNNFNKIISSGNEERLLITWMFNATKDVSHDIHEVHLKVEHTFDLYDFNGVNSSRHIVNDTFANNQNSMYNYADNTTATALEFKYGCINNMMVPYIGEYGIDKFIGCSDSMGSIDRNMQGGIHIGNNSFKITSFASESTHSMFNATKDVSNDIHEVHLKIEHTFGLCDFNGFHPVMYNAYGSSDNNTIHNVNVTNEFIYTVDTHEGTTRSYVCHDMTECESKNYVDYLKMLNGTNNGIQVVCTTSDNGEMCNE